MGKSNKQTSAANAFGAGHELIGKTCNGKTVVDATRRYMTLENGNVIPRAGNYVQHDRETFNDKPDNGYMTDDI